MDKLTGKEKIAANLAAMNKPVKSSSRYSEEDTQSFKDKLDFALEWAKKFPSVTDRPIGAKP